ncbi:hypothetical protein [Neobacillus citreus]|uniref:Uncharacterized protein n=1 Tax=Neobacillus citreus TaxID=2833578 RepID=A0A942YCH8_9BACI|nr:hypothetical protein [Neobacillus citreus]MCH6268040.1 hypothetical protein [Neobacillus citreus]
MSERIIDHLKKKGIAVPEHHIQPLLAQWQAYEQLKSNPHLEKLADYNIGLKHVPGGNENE